MPDTYKMNWQTTYYICWVRTTKAAFKFSILVLQWINDNNSVMHYLLISVSLLKSCNFHYHLLVCKQQLCGLCTRCRTLTPLPALAVLSRTPHSSDMMLLQQLRSQWRRTVRGLGWWFPSPPLEASGKLACPKLQLCLAISCCLWLGDMNSWLELRPASLLQTCVATVCVDEPALCFYACSSFLYGVRLQLL